MSDVEIHTENGIEPAGEAGDRRRAAVITVLVGLAVIAFVVAFVVMSGIADASASGGCGG